MAVAIRLKRIGKKKQPFYRIIVIDSRSKRDGRSIDDLGFYQPWGAVKNSQIDKVKYADWVRKGAQPSETVKKVFKKASKEA